MGKIKKPACAICGKEVGFFGTRRLANGSRICRECQKVIPAPFLDRQYPSVEDARAGAEYGRWAMAKLSPTFAATVQYGRMFLDERNGLFTACDTTTVGKDGKLKTPSVAIYPCIAVTGAEFSISPAGKAVQPQKRGYVACQVQFSGNLEYCGIHIQEAVRKSVPCVLVPGTDGGAAWQEPAELTAFRGCYRQAAAAAWRRMQEAEHARREGERIVQERKQKVREETERLRRQVEAAEGSRLHDAMVLFMLDEGYTMADLKRQRAALMHAFHPDSGNTADSAFAQKINDAYGRLLKNLEGRENP